MSDLIDRQAAIDEIKEIYEWHDNVTKERIIEHFKQLPPANTSEIPNSSDTISRAKAIEAVMECYDNDELFEVYEDKLRELPPAQPKRGKWIKISPANIYECSECGKSVMTNDICAYDFCHGCGADMREVTT